MHSISHYHDNGWIIQQQSFHLQTRKTWNGFKLAPHISKKTISSAISTRVASGGHCATLQFSALKQKEFGLRTGGWDICMRQLNKHTCAGGKDNNNKNCAKLNFVLQFNLFTCSFIGWLIQLCEVFVDFLLLSVALGQRRDFVCLSGIHWATLVDVSWVEVVSTIFY